jgi:2,3-bisphosphoglycerate-dependent phosphoglycerate mutase
VSILVLLRHGESQWNLENRFTGWIDVPLTERGREEARKAGERLRDTKIAFSRCFTSKLQRAQETLRIVLEVLGRTDLPSEEDEALNERHYGDLQGLDKAETAAKYGERQVHLWRRSFDVPPPNGESLKDTAARTLPYFDGRVKPALERGENVLIAAHGNSLRSIVMSLERLSPEQVLELNLATGVPIVYELGPDLEIRTKRILDGSA